MVRLTLPDGSIREFPESATAEMVARAVGKRLAADAVAAKVDGKLVDLSFPIERDATVEIIPKGRPEATEILRHSSAHLLAQAVARRFGPVKLWVGPPLSEGRAGFYYDMDLEHRIVPEDFEQIEAEMMRIVAEDLRPRRFELPVEEAVRLVERVNQPYKVDLIRSFGVPSVSFYEQGEFVDLCEGPHLARTGLVGAVKVLNVTGAYLKGDPSQKMLQRVYGCAFFSRKELDAHLARWAEAEKRDHRRIGTDLDLFRVDPVSPGSPFFFPKGALLYNALVDAMRRLQARHGYDEVITPQLFKSDLWKTSGHYQAFKDDMFMFPFEGAEYGLKPMNCPGHAFLYASRRHSYRELPLRYAEFTRLHRAELSGVLSGLTRVRAFAQDDAHIFCTGEQIDAELDRFAEMTHEVYAALGLGSPEIALETCPPEYLGTDAMRAEAEGKLRAWLARSGVPFSVEPGKGTHYAPKAAFNFRDALDRTWTLSTIQIDFVMPSRFGLTYASREGTPATPAMLHRAILGSIERFLGIYVEHTGGDFPLWLAPVQVRILTITDAQREAAERAERFLRERGIRTERDDSSGKIGAKIREAALAKIPYLAVIGEREAASGEVSIRRRGGGGADEGSAPLATFAERILGEGRPPL